MTARLKMMDFALAGLLITAGTLGYIADLIFLAFYLSIVRRVKGNALYISFFRELCSRKRRKREWLLTRKQREQRQIQRAIEAIAAGALDTKLEVEQFHGQQRELAEAVNNIGSGMSEAVAERIRNERMKADLITNVSHDIKTPLTSIVNYVDLLKRENLENENARNYIRILDEKSQRLKQLTEDLVEASKISSGNIRLDMQRIDFVELLYQIGGEFNERFEQRELTIVTKLPHAPVMVYADGRQMYRAIENLYTNAAKYALEKTRVYVELTTADAKAVFTIRNISKTPLSGTLPDGGNELTERFVRGESSRTTEGSGLGLSIAKNLTQLMGGTFAIRAEDDLFIVTISFDVV
jgi:signal transduction histidine kinase